MTPDRWRCCDHCDTTHLVCKLMQVDGHEPCCRDCQHPPRDKEDTP